VEKQQGSPEKFDRRLLQRFLLIAKPFFASEMKWKAIGLLAVLAGFSILSRGIDVGISYINRDFITALQLREKDDYFYHLYLYLGSFLVATPVVVFYAFTEQRLALLWWQWLSKRLLHLYFSDRSYYKIPGNAELDNTDQRIAEDVRTFTGTSLSFFLIIFNSILTFFAFIGILWTISHTLALAAVLCALLSSIVTYFLGRPLIGYNFLQRKKDADYRYKLVNIRDNAESIAFYRGERDEFRRVRQRLHKAGENLKRIIAWSRNLGFFTQNYNYVISILPIIIVAPLYFEEKIEFGKITQAGLAFGQVLGSLNIIVANFGNLSTLLAVITRLGGFWEAVLETKKKEDHGIQIEERDTLGFKHVTLYTPRRERLLARDLCFLLKPGDRLLITGPSGSGKSSLLRACAGLWTSGEGIIVRPPIAETFFVPQRPYVVLGTLRSQFLYSQLATGLSDTRLIQVIEKVGLDGMLQRVGGFDAQLDWSNILSTGEQQKLAFSRIFLSRSSYVFLDEATTAIDSADERALYSALRAETKGYVSVGHRSTLGEFHNVILELKGNGDWRVERSVGEEA
jgi:vitamin B12/bleomycin/antimicrobial peptide transport system ATP-binding/permease protein